MSNTKTDYKPTKSVMDCVKEYASTHRTFTLNEVAAAYPDKAKSQMATALWKLKVAGGVSRSNEPGGAYTVLTDVNNMKVEAKAAKKPKAKKAQHSEAVKAGMGNTIGKLNTQVAEQKRIIARADQAYEDLATRYTVLQSTHNSLRQQHEDALSIIRYLENKLYVALQQVVKNGNT